MNSKFALHANTVSPHGMDQGAREVGRARSPLAGLHNVKQDVGRRE